MSRSNRSPRTKTQVHKDKTKEQKPVCPLCGSVKNLWYASHLCEECYYEELDQIKAPDPPA